MVTVDDPKPSSTLLSNFLSTNPPSVTTYTFVHKHNIPFYFFHSTKRDKFYLVHLLITKYNKALADLKWGAYI